MAQGSRRPAREPGQAAERGTERWCRGRHRKPGYTRRRRWAVRRCAASKVRRPPPKAPRAAPCPSAGCPAADEWTRAGGQEGHPWHRGKGQTTNEGGKRRGQPRRRAAATQRGRGKAPTSWGNGGARNRTPRRNQASPGRQTGEQGRAWPPKRRGQQRGRHTRACRSGSISRRVAGRPLLGAAKTHRLTARPWRRSVLECTTRRYPGRSSRSRRGRRGGQKRQRHRECATWGDRSPRHQCPSRPAGRTDRVVGVQHLPTRRHRLEPSTVARGGDTHPTLAPSTAESFDRR